MNDELKQQNFILYTDEHGNVKVDVFIDGETVWLTQESMSQLFGVESHMFPYHRKKIYKTDERSEEATARNIRAVQGCGANWS